MHSVFSVPRRCGNTCSPRCSTDLLRSQNTIHRGHHTHSLQHTTNTHTHIHPFNGPFRDYPGEPVQKGKTNLDSTEARDSEWQWHHLGHMQVCTSLQTDNHARTPPLSFLQAGCPSCRPTNSVTQSTEGIIQRTHGLANFVTTQLVFLSDE